MLLYSPIALGDHHSVRTQLDAYRGMHRQLDNGCLHAWYSHHVQPEYPTLTDKMFPFTPIDLRSGYIFGEERILTNRSGYFGWGDDSLFDAHVYDDVGREVSWEVPLVQRGRRHVAEVRLPSGYAAVLVRRRQ